MCELYETPKLQVVEMSEAAVLCMSVLTRSSMVEDIQRLEFDW